MIILYQRDLSLKIVGILSIVDVVYCDFFDHDQNSIVYHDYKRERFKYISRKWAHGNLSTQVMDTWGILFTTV